MPEEIKKSYNPFKMWGSWVGFVVGTVGTLMYGGGAGYLMELFKIDDFTAVSIFLNILQSLGGALQLTNPIILILQWPILPAVLITPIVIFLYGWGIHSIFRKLERDGRIRLLIAVAILVIAGGAYTYAYIIYVSPFYGSERYRPQEPRITLTTSQTIDKMMTTARDESAILNKRLNALYALEAKVSEMTQGEKNMLNEQLVALNEQVNKSSQLDEMDAMAMRITLLQKMLEEK